MIGAHVMIYSKRPEADRAFLRDVFALPHVDVGGGWLIFALPPSELAVHPGAKNDVHELYFMCADIERFVAEMARRGVKCTPVENLGWGIRTTLKLPGGGKLGVYQPRHARPKAAKPRAAPAARRTSARKPAASKSPLRRKKGGTAGT